MLESRLSRIAAKFWETARNIEAAFPRDIEAATAWSVPLFILRIPNLWVHDVETYLREKQLPARISMRSCEGMISSSQAITTTARNSRPFARCIVLIET